MHPARSIIAITAAACLGLPGVALAQLNLICSAPAEWCKIIADEFQKDTGIKVAVLHSGGGEAIAMLAAQAGNPTADVWFGGSVGAHMRGTKFNFLQEYASPMVTQLHPWAQKVAEQSKSQSVGVYAHVLGIGYNSALATQKKIAAPACWKDLIKPGFAGDVHITDPNASGAGYMTIAALAQLFGEDEAFKYLKAMYKAPAAATRGRAAADTKGVAPKGTPSLGAGQGAAGKGVAGKGVAEVGGAGKGGAGKGGAGKAGTGNATAAKAPPPVGNAMAGIGFVGDILAEAESGAQVKTVAPCEGTFYDVGALSIVNGAKNLDNAKKFVDWALGAKAQALSAQAKQYAYPANAGVTVSPLAPKFSDVKFITYDAAKYEKSTARRHLIDRWKQEVGAAAP